VLSNQRSIFRKSRYTILGQQIWLDATATTDITVVPSGGTQYVSVWKDRTVNARNFTQATQANQPIFVPASINGLPSIAFNGTSSFMTFSDQALSFLNASSFTIYYVATKTSAAPAYVFGGQGTGTRNNLAAGYAATNTFKVVFGNDDTQTVVNTVSAGQPELYGITYNTATNQRIIKRNGVVVGQSSSGGSLSGMSGQALGRYLTSYGQFNLGEFLLYNRVLTAYEIAQLEQTLISKWSITG
jgi:hypothetical protein